MLSKQELSILFINWKDLIVTNTKLLKSMRIRQTMNQDQTTIGDILCENVGLKLNFSNNEVSDDTTLLSFLPWLPTFGFVRPRCPQLPCSRGWWRPSQSLTASCVNVRLMAGSRGCRCPSTSSSLSRGWQSILYWWRNFSRTRLKSIRILSTLKRHWTGPKYFVIRF